MDYAVINLQEKLAGFSDLWAPKIIAQMNDYHFKLAKFKGDFVWLTKSCSAKKKIRNTGLFLATKLNEKKPILF